MKSKNNAIVNKIELKFSRLFFCSSALDIEFESDKLSWLKKLGFDKKEYIKHGFNFENELKQEVVIKGKSGLELFF